MQGRISSKTTARGRLDAWDTSGITDPSDADIGGVLESLSTTVDY
jgi:hypothetical protein